MKAADVLPRLAARPRAAGGGRPAPSGGIGPQGPGQAGCGGSFAEGQSHEGRGHGSQDLNIEECRGEFQEK